MGSKALWEILTASGFKPEVVDSILEALESVKGGKIRLDMQSIWYGKLRSIYGYHNTTRWDFGHKKVEALLQALLLDAGIQKDQVMVYFDGDPCLEKQDTSEKRHSDQQKELEKANTKADELAMRNNNNEPISKNQFTAVHRHLSASFNLPLAIREDCCRYLREQGWYARVSRFEADTQIARECGPQGTSF